MNKSIWTKVEDGLPTNRDWYLGTFQEEDTGWVNPIPFVCDYVGKETKATTKEGWIIKDCTDIDNPSDYYRNLKCLAWTSLPERFYKLGEDISDKQRIIDFIKKVIPDNIVCKHISMKFDNDYSACILLSNEEKMEDDEK